MVDARGCQTEIAEKIIEKGTDYVLAVKANQGHLYEAVVDFFETAQRAHYGKCAPARSNGKRKVGAAHRSIQKFGVSI
jgi:predicted transposase YbfD/YdcC